MPAVYDDMGDMLYMFYAFYPPIIYHAIQMLAKHEAKLHAKTQLPNDRAESQSSETMFEIVMSYTTIHQRHYYIISVAGFFPAPED